MKKILITTLTTIIVFCVSCHCLLRHESRCNAVVRSYDLSFGIDYDHPEKYMEPGNQSDLTEDNLNEIREQFVVPPPANMEGIQMICQWFRNPENFTYVEERGRMVGKKTIDELYSSGEHYGCHSQALILSSVLREFGFPAVMVETAAIKWAYQYRRNYNEGFQGHVMTEVFVEDRWILLDNNCKYVRDYHPDQPFIWIPGYPSRANFEDGLFIIEKGIDMWEYCVFNINDANKKMIFFADNIDCFEDYFNTNEYTWIELE